MIGRSRGFWGQCKGAPQAYCGQLASQSCIPFMFFPFTKFTEISRIGIIIACDAHAHAHAHAHVHAHVRERTAVRAVHVNETEAPPPSDLDPGEVYWSSATTVFAGYNCIRSVTFARSRPACIGSRALCEARAVVPGRMERVVYACQDNCWLLVVARQQHAAGGIACINAVGLSIGRCPSTVVVHSRAARRPALRKVWFMAGACECITLARHPNDNERYECRGCIQGR